MPAFFLPPIPLVKESQHPLGGSSSVINVSVSPVTLDLLGDFAVLFQAPLGGLKNIILDFLYFTGGYNLVHEKGYGLATFLQIRTFIELRHTGVARPIKK